MTGQPDLAVMRDVEARALWLATRMIDHANHDRPSRDGLKVGGHQASSASVVSIMTALWLAHLDAHDRVSVKPHASPVLHALWYLLGDLDRRYLTGLREFKGLQAYPSRTKDPDRVDFSTGSVGLGATAPLFAAATRRYVDAHFGPRTPSRFITILGDAELDEGSIWEAVVDPVGHGLGNVMWVVDFNRQSLDRVVPGVRIAQWEGLFTAAGWHVQEVKYGSRMEAASATAGGHALRSWIDALPNEHYQSLFGSSDEDLRASLLDGAPAEVVEYVQGLDGPALADLVFDLGGHDMGRLLEAFRACDQVQDRPSVVFAYTVKGWGLPIAGGPRNHSALLSTAQVDDLRASMGLDRDREWDRFPDDSPAGALCRQRGQHLRLEPTTGVDGTDSARAVAVWPDSIQVAQSPTQSTQEAFGRILVALSREEAIAAHLVTAAPDVATSTNLAGFINRMGVFSPGNRRSWMRDDVLKWEETPAGHHIELGISEINLFQLLGQLGLSHDLSGQRLVPIGTVYDPFVCRGLDALIYGLYSGSRFIVSGTPSGVTLSPEGGAHQSSVTPSLGLELPGLVSFEPAYAQALNWLLCSAVASVGDAGGFPEKGAFYFRLSTRSIDQAPFEAARERLGETVLKRAVLAGAYRLVDGGSGPAQVTIAATGAIVPEALAAAAELQSEGVNAHVVDITSNDRLFRAWRAAITRSVHSARAVDLPGDLRAAFPAGCPIVTVHDGASHALAWLGSALSVPCVSLGVDEFGESGSIPDLYERHDLAAGAIVNGALAALSMRG